MTDFIVVGAGLSGMLVARELTAAGVGVTLLEKGDLGREASWAGGGILSPLYPWRYPDAVTALSRWSRRHYRALSAELAEETGIDPEWLPSGLLIAELEEAEAASAWARRHDEQVEVASAARLADLEPNLTATGGGLWLPDLAQIRNPRLLKALARSLALRKAAIRPHTEVLDLERQGERVIGVRTSEGTLTAQGVIVTAGAWTAELLGTLAAEWHIAPVRGQMLLLRAQPGQVRHVVMRDDHYLVPRRDGRVLVGSTLEYVGFDKSTTAEAHAVLRAAAADLVPALADCPVEQHWAGLRPGSPQGIPVIGEARPGLYVNAGHFRNGVVTGPASARLLADLILARAPCVEPAPYRPPAWNPA